MDRLEKYQERLMELLDSEMSPVEIRRELAADYDYFAYKSYIESFDERMIVIGKELLKKWAER